MQSSFELWQKHIKWRNIYIPFDTREKIIVPKRSSVPCTINIANPEANERFIPEIKPIKGVYFGNAVVEPTIRDGVI